VKSSAGWAWSARTRAPRLIPRLGDKESRKEIVMSVTHPPRERKKKKEEPSVSGWKKEGTLAFASSAYHKGRERGANPAHENSQRERKFPRLSQERKRGTRCPDQPSDTLKPEGRDFTTATIRAETGKKGEGERVYLTRVWQKKVQRVGRKDSGGGGPAAFEPTQKEKEKKGGAAPPFVFFKGSESPFAPVSHNLII